jgi:YbbR domain-containing protein
VAVSINIEKLVVRDIELVNSDISLLNATNDGSLVYEVKTDKIVLQLKGRQSDINALKLENMKPAVDVSGLLEGTHRLPLNINLPNQVKLMQQAQVEVKIAKPAETPGTPEIPGT